MYHNTNITLYINIFIIHLATLLMLLLVKLVTLLLTFANLGVLLSLFKSYCLYTT